MDDPKLCCGRPNIEGVLCLIVAQKGMLITSANGLGKKILEPNIIELKKSINTKIAIRNKHARLTDHAALKIQTGAL